MFLAALLVLSPAQDSSEALPPPADRSRLRGPSLVPDSNVPFFPPFLAACFCPLMILLYCLRKVFCFLAAFIIPSITSEHPVSQSACLIDLPPFLDDFFFSISILFSLLLFV